MCDRLIWLPPSPAVGSDAKVSTIPAWPGLELHRELLLPGEVFHLVRPTLDGTARARDRRGRQSGHVCLKASSV
jgi:hypothetical protein